MSGHLEAVGLAIGALRSINLMASIAARLFYAWNSRRKPLCDCDKFNIKKTGV